MRSSIICVLCAAILGAGIARAELPVGAIAPAIEAKEWLNVDDPIALTDVRGMVVVLYFWVSFHEGGERVIGFVNAVENNPNLGRGAGVMIVGLTDSDKKRTEPMLQDHKIYFPVGAGSDAHKDYQISVYPSIAVIDAEGKIAYVGLPTSADELVKKVQETLAKTPPRKTHPLDAAKARAKLEEARKSIRSEDYRSAFRAARDALELALRGDPLKTLCQEMMDLIEAIGKDKLSYADVFIDKKDFPEAVKTLRSVMRQFQGLDVSKSAKERMDSYKKQFSEVAALMTGEEQENAARSKLLEAQEQIKDRQFGPAYLGLLAVAKEYPSSETADAAKRIRERLEKNKKAMSSVRDHMASKDCESWLGQARSYIRQGNASKARELLNQIRDKYPDTSYADQAGKELAKLR